MTDHKTIFAPQFTEASGPGSTLEFSAPYRVFLERFIRERGIRSITDLGCGDMTIMGHVDMQGASYLGVDVIETRVARDRLLYPHLRFLTSDLRLIEPMSDLVIVKDVIQHWQTDEILVWLAKLVTCKFRYALITNCCYGEVNGDIETGGWRSIALTQPPFSLGRIVFSWGDPNKNVVLLEGARR